MARPDMLFCELGCRRLAGAVPDSGRHPALPEEQNSAVFQCLQAAEALLSPF